MDEPKGTAQDTLQPKAGHPLGSEAGTPEPETPTLTETQAKEQTAKEVQAALMTAGRTAKKFDGREAAIKAREEATNARQTDLDAIQQRLDQAELDAIKGDPDLEAQYRRKQDYAKREKDLATDRQKFEQEKIEHQADIDAANASKKEITIWEIAQKRSVDANSLKTKAEKLNLDTPEQIDVLAETMVAGKAPKKTEEETPEPDSLKTKGGGTPTPEQLENMTMPEYAAYVKKRDENK